MIVNPDNNSTVWYHTTLRERVSSILQNGLKTFSPRSSSGYNRVPWLYVSSKPLKTENPVFKVDLSGLKEHEVKECFGGRVDGSIHQMVFVDIAPDKLSLISETF